MAKIYESIDELIGKTPILRLKNIEKKLGLKAQLFAKLEYFNPAGSLKDRVAKAMIDDITYAGIGIKIIEDAYENASEYFDIDANGNPVAKTDTRRVWLCPIMKDLDVALEKAKEEIDRINALNPK